MVQEIETPAHEQECNALTPIPCCHASGTEERPASEMRATILYMSAIDQKKQLTSFWDATLSAQQ